MLHQQYVRILSVIALAMFIAASVVFFTPISAWAATTCSQTSCDHKDPNQTQNSRGQLCSSGAYSAATNYYTGATLELRWGPNCQTNWARWTSDGIFTCWTLRVQRQSDGVVDDYSACGSTSGSWTNQLYAPGPARACITINGGSWQCTAWV